MATGDLPFKGKKTFHILSALATKTPPAPRELNPDLPRRLSDFIMCLLSKDTADRPKNARVVVAALGDLSQEEDEVVEDLEPVEEEVAEAETEESRPSRKRLKRGKPSRHTRETDEERLTRRVIKFAIFAGVCVFLLLAFLIVKNIFFKKPPSEASAPQATRLA